VSAAALIDGQESHSKLDANAKNPPDRALIQDVPRKEERQSELFRLSVMLVSNRLSNLFSPHSKFG
jgi:hypothetical protein